MAFQELQLPLLNSSKAKPSPLLPTAALSFHIIVLVTTFLITKDGPSCDQDLLSFVDAIYMLSIVGIVLAVLKLALKHNEHIQTAWVAVWSAYIVMVVWLSVVVCMSQTCDETLWYFFLVLAIVGDLFALIVLVVVGLMLKEFGFEITFMALFS